MTIQTYSPEIETQMRNFYSSLSEKDRRRYAAIEALKLGYAGISYITCLDVTDILLDKEYRNYANHCKKKSNGFANLAVDENLF